jgi:hypothetical protein
VLATVASAAQAGDVIPTFPAETPRMAGDVMFRDVPTVGLEAH